MSPGWLSAVRPRPDWLPRASVGLGIAATVAMNVAAGSRGGLGGALLGTLPPAGLLLSLETLIWLVRKLARLPHGWAWCAGAGIPLAGLAGITGVISYLHALTVAEWTGDPAQAGLVLTEHLLPLVADLMIVTGSVALVALAVAGKTATAGVARPDRRLSRDATVPRQSKPAKPRKLAPAGQVRDLVRNLPPERVAQLAAMSKRELAAELGVKVWSAETWLRERRSVNGVAS